MVSTFYAPQRCPLWLTVTDHKGTLNNNDLVWNLMRLILMEEEDLDAEEALQALDEMEMEAFR